jgi:hypothetical protein
MDTSLVISPRTFLPLALVLLLLLLEEDDGCSSGEGVRIESSACSGKAILFVVGVFSSTRETDEDGSGDFIDDDDDEATVALLSSSFSRS